MESEFRILSQAKITRMNMATRKAEVGWYIDYADNATGVHSQVFVPEAAYPNAVYQTIMDELAKIRQVHALGNAAIS